jgi:glutamate/tyrosine decarboxylase-like PLP-dependent enzyme
VRVAYTLEQCWHKVPGGTAVSALRIAEAMDAQADIRLIGVAGRHHHLPDDPWTPPIPVAHLPIASPWLYQWWLLAGWPKVERATGRVDVAHATGLIPCPTDAPLVVTLHDVAFLHDPTQFSRQGAWTFRRSLDRIRASADVVVCSSQATLDDVSFAGIGADRLRRIPVDPTGALDAAALAAALEADAAAGRRPCFIAATVGTTACGAFDPVPAIAAAATRHAAWLHVDAAWAGTAAICPELRGPIVAGADRADSWGFNPHKWMLVNFDCHVLWVADRGPLVRALSMKPEYLRNAATESGAVIDYADWQVPLGRRFRALKLWLTLRMLGAEALRRHVRDHLAWAREFAALVAADPRFDLLGEPSLSLVCFALRDGDAATAALLEQVNAGGTAFLTHARVSGRYAVRLAIGGPLTERRHVLAAWRTIAAAVP